MISLNNFQGGRELKPIWLKTRQCASGVADGETSGGRILGC